MELIVSQYELVYDAILLLVLGYIWLFFLRRWNRYMAELRPFIRNAAVFLGFGFAGRLLDLIGDFVEVPYLNVLLVFSYGVSIVGVVYTMVNYVLLLEKQYLPLRLSYPNSQEAQSNDISRGAYLALGSKSKFIDIMELIKSLQLPTLVFTRNPNNYKGLDFVVPVWVTQATDAGIPPTKLHMIQEHALRFAKEANGSIVVIDCIEYLLMYNEFQSVFKFLVNLKDHLLMLNASLIVAVDKDAIGEKNYKLLLTEFEPL